MVGGYGDSDTEWQTLRRKILERDDYTCKRCGHKSGPYADDDGRVLQAHHIHKRSEGGSDDPDNLITLCRPCHGVQHPDNEVFDESRKQAPLFPNGADDEVADVNSSIEGESLSGLIERTAFRPFGVFRVRCDRCQNSIRRNDGILYPAYEDGDIQYPADNCKVACFACANLIAEENEEGSRRVATLDGTTSPAAQISEVDDSAKMYGSLGELSAERPPENRKEEIIDTLSREWVDSIMNFAAAPIVTAVFIYLFWDGISSAAETLASIIPLGTGITATYVAFVVVLAAVSTTVSALFFAGWKLTNSIWYAFDETIEPGHWRKPGFFMKWFWFTLASIFVYVLPAIIVVGVMVFIVMAVLGMLFTD